MFPNLVSLSQHCREYNFLSNYLLLSYSFIVLFSSIFSYFSFIFCIYSVYLYIGKESVGDDIFKLGNKELSTEAQSKIEKFQNLVLNFVNNYGLLGNFRYLSENYEFMDNEEIPVILWYNMSTTAKEFEKRYFWADSKMDWSKSMKANDLHRNTGMDEITLSKPKEIDLMT